MRGFYQFRCRHEQPPQELAIIVFHGPCHPVSGTKASLAAQVQSKGGPMWRQSIKVAVIFVARRIGLLLGR
jgi:hypothetical protein